MEGAMAEQEKKMAEFQQAHGISKPESLMFNQQAAATTLLSLQGLDSQIAANEGTQGSLRAQLAVVEPYSRVIADGQVLTTPETQLKALQAQYSTLTAQYGPDHPDVVKVRHQIESLKEETGIKGTDTGQLKAQIKDARTNLESAKKTYGPDHPDTVALQHQLDQLEKKLADAGNNEMPNAAIKHDADNPAYLQLVAQLMSTQEQHATLVAQKTVLAKQQGKYQEAVSNDPGLEQQMAALSRDYDNIQLRYRELKEKKMAADMDVQMVQDRQGQRLSIISPPDLPLKTHPSRLLIILAGFVLSIIGGFGSVILTQALSRSVLGSRHLTALVGVPPLVTIPHIYTRSETKRERRRKSLMVSATICLAVLSVVLFNFTVMPLDVLLSIFAQRLGLS
jgi:polysaccharide biosynthesis transport protein